MAVEYIYRICLQTEWRNAETKGTLEGSELDKKDGYFHMSSKEQVGKTANLFYKGQRDLVVLKIATSKLGTGLKWESVSERESIKFPHLYPSNKTQSPSLPIESVVQIYRLPLDPSTNLHVIPDI